MQVLNKKKAKLRSLQHEGEYFGMTGLAQPGVETTFFVYQPDKSQIQ